MAALFTFLIAYYQDARTDNGMGHYTYCMDDFSFVKTSQGQTVAVIISSACCHTQKNKRKRSKNTGLNKDKHETSKLKKTRTRNEITRQNKERRDGKEEDT